MKHVLEAGVVSVLLAWVLIGIAGLAGMQTLGTWLATTPFAELFPHDPAVPLASDLTSLGGAIILFVWAAVALALITTAAALHRPAR